MQLRCTLPARRRGDHGTKKELTPHPNDRNTLLALISFSRDSGDASEALKYAEQLGKIAPQDRGFSCTRRGASAPGG
jgi:hypothetical protein